MASQVISTSAMENQHKGLLVNTSDDNTLKSPENTQDVMGAGAVRRCLVLVFRKTGYMLFADPLKLFKRNHMKVGLGDVLAMWHHAMLNKHGKTKAAANSTASSGTAAAAGSPGRAAILHTANKFGFRNMIRFSTIVLGIQVMIGSLMFTTFEKVLSLAIDVNPGIHSHAELKLGTYVLAGTCAGISQATLSCPWSNILKYYHNHQRWGEATRLAYQKGELFRHYPRILRTETLTLPIFFAGYEALKRSMLALFPEKRTKSDDDDRQLTIKSKIKRVCVVLGAGGGAASLYNILSYPISRLHHGIPQCFRGFVLKNQFGKGMIANAIGFLLYEYAVDEDYSLGH